MFEVQNEIQKKEIITDLDKVLETDNWKEIFFRIRVYKIILLDESFMEYFHIFTDDNTFDSNLLEEKIKEWFESFKWKTFTVRADNISEYDIVKYDVYFSGMEDFDDEHLSKELVEMLSQVYDNQNYPDESLVLEVRNHVKNKVSEELAKLEYLVQWDKVRAVIEKTKENISKEIIN